MPSATLEQRIDRLESQMMIRELPARYALAVDARDLDGWTALFVDDVDCGRHGVGREALKRFIDASVRTFYRSVHLICGQVVDFRDADNATGSVYCRAEHEDGDRWVAMAIIYRDVYARRDGRWYFVRRTEQHWYSTDVLERPAPPFQQWDAWASRLPQLPAAFPTWAGFWERSDPADIAKLTRQPATLPPARREATG